MGIFFLSSKRVSIHKTTAPTMSSTTTHTVKRLACVNGKPVASKQRATPGLKFAPSLALKMPAHSARLRSTGRRSQVVSVKATANPTDDGFSFTGAAKNMGFDLSDGLFGFTPFSELWVGRLAMIGFAAGMAGEFASGKGILMQLGLCDGTPNYPLFTLLSVAMGTATLAATTKTLVDLNTGTISKTQMGRYAQFFGIDDKATEDASRTLKAEGDFTSPDNFKDIAAARQNMPADAVLGTSFEAELEASTSAASAMQAQG